MHAAVDETNDSVVACCTPPPAEVNKPYLTNMALLTSAKAFSDASVALANSADPKAAVYAARVNRARMANLYTVLWRWKELRSFAANLSLPWPMAEVTLETAFNSFALQYNKTGTKQLTIARGGPTAAGGDLRWLHDCLFDTCPGSGSSVTVDYAEVVLDECPDASSTPACLNASRWTKLPSTTVKTAVVFENGLSVDQTCYTLNVPAVPVPASGDMAQVVAYGDSSGVCDRSAPQNTFQTAGGMLKTPNSVTTSMCSSKTGCCVQADGISSTTVSMVACDTSNPLQQFLVESLEDGPTAGRRIRDKHGRCLTIKNCKVP
jgi:hypothetical protein